jgi:hypothetical protein
MLRGHHTCAGATHARREVARPLQIHAYEHTQDGAQDVRIDTHKRRATLHQLRPRFRVSGCTQRSLPQEFQLLQNKVKQLLSLAHHHRVSLTALPLTSSSSSALLLGAREEGARSGEPTS